MAIEIVSGFECPYCRHFEDGTSEVYVDAEKVAWLRENHVGNHIDVQEHPDKHLLRFNNNVPDTGPCQHVVILVGYCAWGVGGNGRIGEFRWELNWDWHSPELRCCDQGTRELLWQLPDRSTLGTPLRKMAWWEKVPYLRLPYRIEDFGRQWVDCHSVGRENAMYCVQVTTFYARDVQSFVSDLKANGVDAVERYEKLVQSGTREMAAKHKTTVSLESVVPTMQATLIEE